MLPIWRKHEKNIINYLRSYRYCGLHYLLDVSKADRRCANLEYANIVMNDVVDGTYEGHIETMLIKVKVNVTVENHSLKNIEILQHDNGFGEPAEEIVKTMIQKNNYQVDVKVEQHIQVKLLKVL